MGQLKKILAIVAVFFLFPLYGVDLQFSNYNFSDAYLNPTLPSHIEEDLRVNVKYRGQWETFANAYTTILGQVDISPLNKSSRFCGKKLVISPQVIHDRAGSLQKATSSFNLNVAYSQFLDRQYKTQIALGLQVGYMMNSIDLSKATFGSDYYGGSSAVPNVDPRQRSINIAAGASMAFYPVENFNISAGFGAYNLLEPNVAFERQMAFYQQRRFTGYLNMNYAFSETQSINAYTTVQYQNPFSNYQFGATWGSRLSSNLRNAPEQYLYLGAGLRWKDAVIASVGYRHSNYTVAFNYDFNYSKLIASSRSAGAFELSFAFATDWFKSPKGCARPIPCSKMR